MKPQNLFSVEENFFLISSDNLESVNTRMYGYCISDGQIITDAADLNGGGYNLTPDGTYVYIQRTKDKILIRQDFVGCYGLYLFREGDYWALSNSFIYLLDHVKKSHTITFNRQYADHFLVAGLSAQSYSETLINEISCLDRSAVIEIDLKDRTLKTRLINYMENSIDLDSVEGMQLLDSWFFKWTNLIRNLKSSTNNITMQLSGGHETRMVLGLFLGSGIDLNEINVFSNTDGLHVHAEDFRIATKIADFYGFKLNNAEYLSKDKVNFSLQDALNISLNSKLGFHTHMYWGRIKRKEPYYLFSGEGIVRYLAADLPSWKYENTFIDSQAQRAKPYGSTVSESVRAILDRSFTSIKNKYNNLGRSIPAEDICYFFYRETRNRNHYGKGILESYLSGIIKLCPILDSMLHKLKQSSRGCDDRNLLVAVIFDRYNRDLLNFEIEGGRNTAEATIKYAHYLNEKYPFVQQASPETFKLACKTKTELSANCKNVQIAPQALRSLIKNAFYSPEVRSTFTALYPSSVYSKLAELWEKTKFFPEANAYVVLAITKAYQDCLANRTMNGQASIADYILLQSQQTASAGTPVSPLFDLPYMAYYVTARIDLKNYGSDSNDLNFMKISDSTARVHAPQWFNKNGHGHVIASDRGTLDLRFCCIGEGLLKIVLRGMDVRDKDKKRIPIWIDYTSLQINGETVFSEEKSVWHDRPYATQRKVKDGDEIFLSVTWRPHNPCKA